MWNWPLTTAADYIFATIWENSRLNNLYQPAMISDFSESELDNVRTLSQQRFKKEIEPHIANSELNLDKETDVLTECVAALLQTQSDHERESRSVKPGATGEDLM